MRRRIDPDPERWGAAPFPGPRPAQGEVLTVWELTRRIKARLEPAFSRVAVEGEMSNLARPRSGHVYFTLKDDRAQLRAVLWRATAVTLRFPLRDGLRVVAVGRLAVYEPRGVYQMICERLVPRGTGELALAFEALKRRLAAAGLFDAARKRPLPSLPRVVGLVTSPSGAAVRDMLESMRKRFPRVTVRIFPTRVQGAGAAGEITAAIRRANELQAADVLVVGRGGGGLEDLWAFNEEVVARAIAASAIPVVSAVGHEVDFTIADFVADARAPTPTAAGAMVVPREEELRERIAGLARRLTRAARDRVAGAREALDRLHRGPALARPMDRVNRASQRLDELTAGLIRGLYNLRTRWHDRWRRGAERLEALSPLAVLGRGYSVTLDERGRAIRSARDLEPGSRVRTLLWRGAFWSAVEAVEEEAGLGGEAELRGGAGGA